MHVVVLYFFVCVQFIFHFVLLALNFARLGVLQYLLGYASTCKVCVCVQIHMLLFFSQGQNNRAPSHDLQQSMGYS